MYRIVNKHPHRTTREERTFLDDEVAFDAYVALCRLSSHCVGMCVELYEFAHHDRNVAHVYVKPLSIYNVW